MTIIGGHCQTFNGGQDIPSGWAMSKGIVRKGLWD